MRKRTYVCVPCRTTGRSPDFGVPGRPGCPHCGTPMTAAPRDWRPPHRRDERAWAVVSAGQWLTEPALLAGARSPRRWSRQLPQVPYPVRTRRPVTAAKIAPADARAELQRVLRECAPGTDLTAALAPYAAHPDVEVRLILTGHAATPADVLRPLLTDAAAGVRARALTHPNAPVTPRLLKGAARSGDAAVRTAAAGCLQTPPDCLRQLLTDSAPAVVLAAAANRATRLRDLLDAPAGVVPTTRLEELIAVHGPRPLRGAGTKPAVALIADLATSGATMRDALATAAAVLG